MELKIIIDNKNALFNRTEIEGEIKAEITPSRTEVRKALAEKYSISEDTIKIRTIKGAYGSQVFLLVGNIYKSKADKESVEHAKKKDVEAEKKAAEEAPKEEKPVEETKADTLEGEDKPKETGAAPSVDGKEEAK